MVRSAPLIYLLNYKNSVYAFKLKTTELLKVKIINPLA